jgi:hypothetical protein
MRAPATWISAAMLIVVGCSTQAPQRATPSTLRADENPPVVRTDFSSDPAWKDLCRDAATIPSEVREGVAQMLAANGGDPAQRVEMVGFIDDSQYAGFSPAQLRKLVPRDSPWGCLLIADGRTFADPVRPLLVLELAPTRSRTFRTIPAAAWANASNLSIGNVDWEDFANHVDSDGVYRGRDLVE